MYDLSDHIVDHAILGVVSGGSGVTGSGAVDRLAVFTTASAIGSSLIAQVAGGQVATINTSNLSAPTTFYLVDPGPLGGYIPTGGGTPGTVAMWTAAASGQELSSTGMTYDGTTLQFSDVTTTSSQISFYPHASTNKMNISATSVNDTVTMQAPAASGKWVFTGGPALPLSAPIVEVTGKLKATNFNGLTITDAGLATVTTLTIATGKTFTVNHSLTLAGTDSTIMTFPTTSATIARIDAANTFTGTQTIGALVATTINGNTFTTGTGTLTIAAAKTLTVSNTLTLAGTDSTIHTFPATTSSVARIDALQTFVGVQTFSSQSLHSAGISLSTSGIVQVDIANSGTNTPACVIRNSVKLTSTRPVLEVDWYTGSAYQAMFWVAATGAGGTTKEFRLMSDSTNYLQVTCTSAGVATFTVAGSAPGITFTGTSVIFNATTTALNSTLLGFYGVTPVARPGVFTQTYATASHTHAAPLAAAVDTTVATNSAPYGYAQAQANDIVAQLNKLVTDMANVKQTLNAVIDDGKLTGLLQ